MLPWIALERVKGIEPSYAAWEAAVLPLNYTRAGREFYDGQWKRIVAETVSQLPSSPMRLRP